MKTYKGLFVGVDVGTGSARAALVTESGTVLKTAVKPIKTWNPSSDHYEQSSNNIWESCKSVVKVICLLLIVISSAIFENYLYFSGSN